MCDPAAFGWMRDSSNPNCTVRVRCTGEYPVTAPSHLFITAVDALSDHVLVLAVKKKRAVVLAVVPEASIVGLVC